MRDLSRGAYPLEKREVVMEGKDLRVSVLTLAPGQYVPWHYHFQVADAFFCLEGPMVVETRARARRACCRWASPSPCRR
jgi:quercetin dioxygenase-like cupin family protein